MFEYECWKCNEWHIIADDMHERDAFDWGYEMEVDVRRTDTKESIIGKDRYWLGEAIITECKSEHEWIGTPLYCSACGVDKGEETNGKA